jgi:prepilin-type N-terminal cleavage/methylation domain-containing protein
VIEVGEEQAGVRTELSPTTLPGDPGPRDTGPGLFRRQRGQDGFTLVELIIVLAIAALGAALVLPNVMSTVRNMEIKRAARDLTTVFRYARSRAISSKVTTTVSINLETNVITINSDNPTVRLKDGSGDSKVRSDKAPLDFLEKPSPIIAKEGGGSASRQKRLSQDVVVAFESFFRSDILYEGTIDIEFYSKGNCLGGIFYVTNERGWGYHVWLDALTGIAEIGTELEYFN